MDSNYSFLMNLSLVDSLAFKFGCRLNNSTQEWEDMPLDGTWFGFFYHIATLSAFEYEFECFEVHFRNQRLGLGPDLNIYNQIDPKNKAICLEFWQNR